MVSSADDTLKFFADQLRNDLVSAKVETLRKTHLIARSIGTSSSRQHLIPLLEKLLPDAADEVLFTVAEILPGLLPLFGSAREEVKDACLKLVPILQVLLSQEETLVRQAALDATKKVLEYAAGTTSDSNDNRKSAKGNEGTNDLRTQLVENHLVPLVAQLSREAWFPPRLSACSLVPILYPHCGEEQKNHLRNVFNALALDETPMVRRCATAQLETFCYVAEKPVLHKTVLPLIAASWKADGPESMKICALRAMVTAASLLPAEDTRAERLTPLVGLAVSSRIWKVKLAAAELFDKIALNFAGRARKEVLTSVAALLVDDEVDIRAAALASLGRCVKQLSREDLEILNVEKAMTAAATSEDATSTVRAAAAAVIADVTEALGPAASEKTLLPIIKELMASDVIEIRLKSIHNAARICSLFGFAAVGPAIVAAMETLVRHELWRVRKEAAELIPQLAKQFGLEAFQQSLEPLFLVILDDTVSAVRETGIASIKELGETFGPEWAGTQLLPRLGRKFHGLPQTDGAAAPAVAPEKIGGVSYLVRISVIRAVPVLAQVVSPTVVENDITQLIDSALQDTVSNVRLVACKVSQELLKEGKKELRPMLISKLKPLLKRCDSLATQLASCKPRTFFPMQSIQRNTGSWKPVTVSLGDIRGLNVAGFSGLEELDLNEASLQALLDGDTNQRSTRSKRRLNSQKDEGLSACDSTPTVDGTKKKEHATGEVSSSDSSISDKPTASWKTLKRLRQWESYEPICLTSCDSQYLSEWIAPAVLINLKRNSFAHPTEIQKATLTPAIVQRKDIVAAAETGSGKTLAFGIPIVTSIISAQLGRREKGADLTPKLNALLIFPSRELARQAHQHIAAITVETPIKIACIVGGMSAQKQLRVLDTEKPEIVCGTPGRLCAALGCLVEESAASLDSVSAHMADLSRLRHLVLDEADRLTEKGHFAELGRILRRVYAGVDNVSQLQTFIISATLALVPNTSRGKKSKCGRGRKLQFKAAESSSKNSTTDTPLAERMAVLMRTVNLRESHLFSVDLSRREKAEAEVAADAEKERPSKKARVDLKLPDKLAISLLTVSDVDKEWELYALLHEFFRRRLGSKVMIFVNAITYVLRLEPILRLLMENGVEQVLRKGDQALKKSKDSQSPALCVRVRASAKQKQSSSPAPATHGTQLLSQFLEKNSRISIAQQRFTHQKPDENDVHREEDAVGMEHLVDGEGSLSCPHTESEDNGNGSPSEYESDCNDRGTPSYLDELAEEDSSSVDNESRSESDASSVAVATTLSPKKTLSKIPQPGQQLRASISGIHSKLKQIQRMKKLERFVNSKTPSVLICTDVAARGLDLPEVDLVIHLQAPRSSTLFVHRSGRTARAGREGRCVCISSDREAARWSTLFHRLRLGNEGDRLAMSCDILDDLDTDQAKKLKRQFKLALRVDGLAHQAMKIARDMAWKRKAAKDLDIEVSDSECNPTLDHETFLQMARHRVRS